MRKSIVPWFFKLDTYSWNFFIIWIIYPLFDFARQKKSLRLLFRSQKNYYKYIMIVYKYINQFSNRMQI